MLATPSQLRTLHTGTSGLAHVRYPTAGGASAKEAQPFFVNSPLGIFLIHNGNLTNTESLRQDLASSASYFHRLLRTPSDSEVLLNVFADEIHRAHQRFVADYPDQDPLDKKMQFVQEAGESLMQVQPRTACVSAKDLQLRQLQALGAADALVQIPVLLGSDEDICGSMGKTCHSNDSSPSINLRMCFKDVELRCATAP